jgi:hypothetical protein
MGCEKLGTHTGRKRQKGGDPSIPFLVPLTGGSCVGDWTLPGSWEGGQWGCLMCCAPKRPPGVYVRARAGPYQPARRLPPWERW